MKHIELLRARIALYHRYLREGADGDLARAYLWLIRKDEIELANLAAADQPQHGGLQERGPNDPQASTMPNAD